MKEIASGLVCKRPWEVHHSMDHVSTSLDQTICSYKTTPSWTIQLLTFQKPEAWTYREIIASFFLNAFSCHSIETLINLVTIADAIDMGNSHATCVLLISAHGRNIGYAIEKIKDSDRSLILLLSIQFLMNMIEWFSNLFIWASVGGLGEGTGNPLQSSCLENPRDSRAWWAAVYGVAQSRTRLKRLSSGWAKKKMASWTHHKIWLL